MKETLESLEQIPHYCSEPAPEGVPNLGTPSRGGAPKWGPKPRSNIGVPDGCQCDLAHITCSGGPQNGVPRSLKMGVWRDPKMEGFG